jgi:hypothetical protein
MAITGPLAVDIQIAETTYITGTGPYTLNGPIAGFFPFSAEYIDGQSGILYRVSDGANTEETSGTYTAATNSLSRDTIIVSTNGGNPVNWSGRTRPLVQGLVAVAPPPPPGCPNVGSRGSAPASASSVTFTGVPVIGGVIQGHCLGNTSGCCSTPASSFTFLYAAWVFPPTIIFPRFRAGGVDVYANFRVGPGNVVEVALTDSSGNYIFIGDVSNTLTGGAWNSMVVSGDISQQLVQVAVNTTVTNATGTWSSSNPVVWSGAELDEAFAQLLFQNATFQVSDVRFGMGEPFFDLSVPANLAKFVGAGNTYVSWGPHGEYPTGAPPSVFLSGGLSQYTQGCGANWGNFEVPVGTLSAGTSTP